MFGRHRRELCCILPTHRVWVCWNWLPQLRNPPGAESSYLTVTNVSWRARHRWELLSCAMGSDCGMHGEGARR